MGAIDHADRPRPRRGVLRASLAALAIVALACEEEAPAPAPPAVEVAFITVRPRTVTVTEELPGRVRAFRTAEVRARTSGIVLRRHVQGGERVREGQTLFTIDPAPLRAAADRASAALAQAEASAALAQAQQRRADYLVGIGAISEQAHDTAVAEARSAAAGVEEMRAALREAQVELSYATVTAPIDGVVGIPLVTEGALVGEGDATPLAMVQQLDPVYVDLEQPAAALSSLRAAGLAEAPVTILAGEGEDAPEVEGRLLSADVSIDPGTGEVTLRALVPNEERLLLPGQYVRARVPDAVREGALLVPQQAVQRMPDGSAQRVVRDRAGAAERRPVRVGPRVARELVIEEGLRAGERVVVEGQDKVRPGVRIEPRRWEPAEDRPTVASTEP